MVNSEYRGALLPSPLKPFLKRSVHGRSWTSYPFLLLLLIIVLLSSCQSFKAPEFRNVENIRLAKLGRAESTLLADVRYYNPNKTKLKLKEAHGEAWLDGTYLGNFTVDSLVHIPGEAEFSLPVSLRTDMSKILQNSLSAFLKKEVTIKIQGRAKVGKGIVYINYPINYEGKQELEKLLK